MFSADISSVQFWEDSRDHRNHHGDDLDYLFPKFTYPSPWINRSATGKIPLMEDFVLIAEFSEQEGPRPVIVIPKDGGSDFDQNEFSVKILAVDHQSSIVEGSNETEDAQVVMSDSENNAHAFIHHIVLNDIQARGYVRPFCISYVTADSQKIMKCYETISTQMKKVAKMMKYGNRLVFMRDLEKYLEDLDFTKAHLLFTQRAQVSSSSSNDNEVLAALNTIRQSMEEVRDILSKLRNMLKDSELQDKFQAFERQSKTNRPDDAVNSDDRSSLRDFPVYQKEAVFESSGSYTDRLSPEFSLFGKSKDLKPKLLDVSTLKGKRRFDRSLRSLHELCSWGAREGLRKLRSIREYLMTDYANIYMDELDERVSYPDSSLLSFGYDTIGSNFLTCYSSRDAMYCQKKGCSSHPLQYRTSQSVDSFKSLPSSYHSILDDDTLYSAQSSMMEGPSQLSAFERQSSITDSFDTRESFDDEDDRMFFHDGDPDFCREYSTSVLHGSFMDTIKGEDIAATLKPEMRKESGDSEFDIIDKDKDLTCNVPGCSCNIMPTGHATTVDTRVKHDAFGSVASLKTDKEIDNFPSNISSKDQYGIKPNDANTRNPHMNHGIKSIQNDSSLDRPITVQRNFAMNISVIATFPSDTCKGIVKPVSEKQSDDVTVYNVDQSQCNLEGNVDLTDSTTTLCDKDQSSEIRTDDVTVYNVDQSQCNVEGNVALTDSTTTLCDKDQSSVIYNSESMTNCDNACSRGTSCCDLDSQIKDGNCMKGAIQSELKPASVQLGKTDRQVGELKLLNSLMQSNQAQIVSSQSDRTGTVCNQFLPSDSETCQTEFSQSLSFTRGSVYEGAEPNQTTVNDFVSDFSSLTHTFEDSSLDKLKGEMKTAGFYIETSSVGSDTDSLDSHTQRLNVEGEKLKQKIENTLDFGGQRSSFSKRKETLFLPFTSRQEADDTCSKCLQKLLCEFNSLQHVIYSLLSGRPVVIVGTRRTEQLVREMIFALTIFTPIVASQTVTSLLCQIKQLKMSDLRKVQLRGVLRSENRPVEFLIPTSVRRYITLVDVEKMIVSSPPYQGMLLNFVGSIYTKKRSFKSSQALYKYIQMCLMELSTRAFTFYHCITESDADTDFCGVCVPRKSAMLELSSDKYLNKSGLINSDCRIIKNLAELVKIQQIEEEFKCKYLTDSPVYPFSVSYQPIHTYRM